MQILFRLIKFAVKRCCHEFDVDILFETKSIVARNLRLTGIHFVNCQLDLQRCIGAVKINSNFDIQLVN